MFVLIDINLKFPYHTTIYKFYMKYKIKYNVINLTYIRLLKKYTSNNKTNNKYYVDTTLIINKYVIYKIVFMSTSKT